jgi:hypothetical protein
MRAKLAAASVESGNHLQEISELKETLMTLQSDIDDLQKEADERSVGVVDERNVLAVAKQTIVSGLGDVKRDLGAWGDSFTSSLADGTALAKKMRTAHQGLTASTVTALESVQKAKEALNAMEAEISGLSGVSETICQQSAGFEEKAKSAQSAVAKIGGDLSAWTATVAEVDVGETAADVSGGPLITPAHVVGVGAVEEEQVVASGTV